MDIRGYFRKLREAQSTIASEFVVIVSLETADGGKPGRMVEVTREVAAHMIVDGRGRIATTEEEGAFRAEMADLVKAAQMEQEAGKVRFTWAGPDALSVVSRSNGKRDRE
jgi:hypothetical protein